MTRSSQPVHKHILDFDIDFERTLRRARNQQEPQPSQPAPDLEEDKVEEQEEATTRTFEEVTFHRLFLELGWSVFWFLPEYKADSRI